MADATTGADRGAEQVGARGQLTQQQCIETAPLQRCAQIAPNGGQTLLLVDRDELDAGQVAHEFGLEPADDPGDARLWRMQANALHQRQHVGDIA